MRREDLTAYLRCSEDMDLVAFRRQILLSNKTASEKAKAFLLKSKVNDMSTDEWRRLIAGIPEEVEEDIGKLKSAGPSAPMSTFGGRGQDDQTLVLTSLADSVKTIAEMLVRIQATSSEAFDKLAPTISKLL